MESTLQPNRIVDFTKLCEALEASWCAKTSYSGTFDPANPAKGQCYVTSKVLQHFFPELRIAQGVVETPTSVDDHFWNYLPIGARGFHIDLTWQQFEPGGVRSDISLVPVDDEDSGPTIMRCALLLARVLDYLTVHCPDNAFSP